MKVIEGKIFDVDKFQRIENLGRKKTTMVSDFNKYIEMLMATPSVEEKAVSRDPNLMGLAPVVLVTSDSPKVPDRGYELLFDEVDLRETTNDTFELLNVTGGITFYQHKPGGKAKLSKISKAAKTAVGCLRFSGGFPVLDDWLRFNRFFLIEEITADTVRDWYQQKAALFYGLMSALDSSINQAFDSDDVTTINNACASILEVLHGKGYAVGGNEAFAITCHPTLKARIYKALAASFMNPNANNNAIVFPIVAVISTLAIANSFYYVSLPGWKNKRGEWEDFNARPPQRDELILGADHVWTGAYNGIIGEKDQHRRCSLS